MSRSEIEEKIRSFFEQEKDGPVAVYLFGSEARGTAGAASDVDIAVLYETPPPRTLDGLQIPLKGDLEALLNRYVDLVVLNHASLDLSHRVFRDGVVLVDRDRMFRLAFEVKRRNEYLDFFPVLQLYRRYPVKATTP